MYGFYGNKDDDDDDDDDCTCVGIVPSCLLKHHKLQTVDHYSFYNGC
jgi:hypothetical protein